MWRPSLGGWRPSLGGWRHVEAITRRVEAIASRVEAITRRVEAIPSTRSNPPTRSRPVACLARARFSLGAPHREAREDRLGRLVDPVGGRILVDPVDVWSVQSYRT